MVPVLVRKISTTSKSMNSPKKTQEIKTYQMHTVYLCNSVGISCTVVAIFANPSLRLKFPLKRDHSLVLKS